MSIHTLSKLVLIVLFTSFKTRGSNYDFEILNRYIFVKGSCDYSVFYPYRIQESESVVSVIRHNEMRFLTYDKSIIGAKFEDEYYEEEAVFSGFGIMQASVYLDSNIRNAIQIGLGIGTVPSFLRKHGIPTDVVEISPAVVALAEQYFEYEKCTSYLRECMNGETYVEDGAVFLYYYKKPKYDLFIVDVYTGWNPLLFFTIEKIELIKSKWISPGGTLVMNFFGFYNGEQATLSKLIYKTISLNFNNLRCFRDDPDSASTDAANLIYFASDEEITFDLPTHGKYKHPEKNTYYDVIRNFESWEIFESESGSDSSNSDILHEFDNLDKYNDINLSIKKHMSARMEEVIPQEAWNLLGLDSTKDEL